MTPGHVVAKDDSGMRPMRMAEMISASSSQKLIVAQPTSPFGALAHATFGLHPLRGDEPIDLYEIVRLRYQRASTIITSNSIVA